MIIICNISVMILLRKEGTEIKMLDRSWQLGGKLLQ
jgi:hypothetical protein